MLLRLLLRLLLLLRLMAAIVADYTALVSSDADFNPRHWGSEATGRDRVNAKPIVGSQVLLELFAARPV